MVGIARGYPLGMVGIGRGTSLGGICPGYIPEWYMPVLHPFVGGYARVTPVGRWVCPSFITQVVYARLSSPGWYMPVFPSTFGRMCPSSLQSLGECARLNVCFREVYARLNICFREVYARFCTFRITFWPVLTVKWLCSGSLLLARVPEVYPTDIAVSAHYCTFSSNPRGL